MDIETEIACMPQLLQDLGFSWLRESNYSSSFFGEIRSLISNNPYLSVRSSVSCGVLVFVSSFPCDGRQWRLDDQSVAWVPK